MNFFFLSYRIQEASIKITPHCYSPSPSEGANQCNLSLVIVSDAINDIVNMMKKGVQFDCTFQRERGAGGARLFGTQWWRALGWTSSSVYLRHQLMLCFAYKTQCTEQGVAIVVFGVVLLSWDFCVVEEVCFLCCCWGCGDADAFI